MHLENPATLKLPFQLNTPEGTCRFKPQISYCYGTTLSSVPYHKCNFLSQIATCPHCFSNVLALQGLLYHGAWFSVQLQKCRPWSNSPLGPEAMLVPTNHQLIPSWQLEHQTASLPLLLWGSCDSNTVWVIFIWFESHLCLYLYLYLYLSLSLFLSLSVAISPEAI